MTHSTLIDLGDLGEREAEVEYWYSPYEPANYNVDNNPHPSSPEDVEFTSITITLGGHKIDVIELIRFANPSALSSIAEEICEIERERLPRRRYA